MFGGRARYVLLGVGLAVRRADAGEVIAVAVESKVVQGRGHRVIAARLGRPVTTVRGWLQGLGRRFGVVGTVAWVRAGIAASGGRLFSAGFWAAGVQHGLAQSDTQTGGGPQRNRPPFANQFRSLARSDELSRLGVANRPACAARGQ